MGRTHTAVKRLLYFTSTFAGISMQWSLIKSSTIFSLSRKSFSLKGSPLEVKPNRIKDFLLLDPSEIGFLGVSVVFLEACHRLYNEAKTCQRSENNGAQSDPPATAEVITALPATILQSRFFFESCGTIFYSCNVSCCSGHKVFFNISIVLFERVVSMWLKSKMYCRVVAIGVYMNHRKLWNNIFNKNQNLYVFWNRRCQNH